jgi:hypothetical protein
VPNRTAQMLVTCKDPAMISIGSVLSCQLTTQKGLRWSHRLSAHTIVRFRTCDGSEVHFKLSDGIALGEWHLRVPPDKLAEVTPP